MLMKYSTEVTWELFFKDIIFHTVLLKTHVSDATSHNLKFKEKDLVIVFEYVCRWSQIHMKPTLHVYEIKHIFACTKLCF